MNALAKIFNTRIAEILCFLFAVINRIVFTTIYSLVGTDTKIQLTYAENLMLGKGIGITKYFTNDIQNAVFDTQQMFPPGFSLAIIPFLKIFGGNEFNAVLGFDILAAIILVISVRTLAKRIGLSNIYINLLLLVVGCSQYVFFMSWSSTDAVGLFLAIFALAATIKIIERNENVGLLKLLGYSILFCSPFFFRYMYLPFAVMYPVIIFFFAKVSGQKKLIAVALKLFFLSACILAILFSFSLSMSKNALFVQNIGRGFYFNQIINWYPFIPASFINLDFGTQLVEKISGITYGKVMRCFEILNIILFIPLLILLWRYFNNYKTRRLSNHFIFIISGSILSGVILFLLFYLSLTYKELPWGLAPAWTHIRDERYFAFIYVFTQISFFVFLQFYSSKVRRSFLKLFVFVGLILLATETIHGIYYNIKIIGSRKDSLTIRDADKGYRSFVNLMKQIRIEKPGYAVLVCSPDEYYTCAASLLGDKAIFDYRNLGHANLKVQSKSILILPVHEQEVNMMQEYLLSKKPKLYTTIANTYFYIEEINPEQ